MKKNTGIVYIYDWPTGSGKTLGVYNQILGKASSFLAVKRIMHKTAIFVPALGMRQAWIRDLGIFAIERDFISWSRDKSAAARIDDWKNLSGRKRERLLKELDCLPRFFTFRDLNKGIRKRTESGRCEHLVMDEWHRLGTRFKLELQKNGQGKYGRKWWNLLNQNNEGFRNIYLSSATPLNPVKESKNEEKNEISEDKEIHNLNEELQRSVKVISVFSGKERLSKVKLWHDLASKDVKLVGPPKRTLHQWKLPILPTKEKISFSNILRKELEKLRLREVRMIEDAIKNSHPYTNEFRYCQSIVKTHAKMKRHFIGGKKSSSFSLKYSNVFDPTTASRSAFNFNFRDAEAWVFNHNGRILRLLILLEHFKIIQPRSVKSNRYPIRISTLNKRVVIFCTHKATAKGLFNTLRKILPADQQDAIAASFQRVGKKQARSQNSDLIHRFNKDDDDLRILIATDAFSESYDLHEKCWTVIHFEMPWSPHRLFQRVGRVTRIIFNRMTGELYFRDVEVGHVIIPGSVEEEQVQRLKRRIELLAQHHLLPGILDKDKQDQVGAFFRYLGVGSSWGAQRT